MHCTHVNPPTSALTLVYYTELCGIACMLFVLKKSANSDGLALSYFCTISLYPYSYWLFLCALQCIHVAWTNEFICFLQTGPPALPPPPSEEVVKEMNMWCQLISHYMGLAFFRAKPMWCERWANCIMCDHFSSFI